MPETDGKVGMRGSCCSFGDLVVREQVPVASGIRTPPRRRGVVKLTAESFGDGRTDVPGGVAGLVERVVVVGAGIAGLTVANALTHAGVERVVPEARDRIGRRVHTVDLAGSPVDLGRVMDTYASRESDQRLASRSAFPAAAQTRCLAWRGLTAARDAGCRPLR